MQTRPAPFALFLLALAFLLQPGAARSQDGLQPGIQGFWEVVTATGSFTARLDQISSVSQHEYLIDGAVRVFECTVDTNGGQTARFYYLEPITESVPTASGSAAAGRLREIANQSASKAGLGEFESMVTKHYPDTTHAKTSEYRLRKKETVAQIYQHARRVWAEERGRGGENQLVVREG